MGKTLCFRPLMTENSCFFRLVICEVFFEIFSVIDLQDSERFSLDETFGLDQSQKKYDNTMNKSILTIVLLVLSNSFMTLAWYGHLKFKAFSWFGSLGLLSVILVSRGIAFFE